VPKFTPPIVYDRGPYNPDSTEIQKALFKFFPTSPRYVQVFFLSNGSFVQDTPNGFAPDGSVVENENTNYPYPWNFNDPSGPYNTSWYYDYSQNPPVRVIEYDKLPEWIEQYFNGVTEVSQGMANALIAAGYGACIS
jgi:hypothetical protein